MYNLEIIFKDGTILHDCVYANTLLEAKKIARQYYSNVRSIKSI